MNVIALPLDWCVMGQSRGRTVCFPIVPRLLLLVLCNVSCFKGRSRIIGVKNNPFAYYYKDICGLMVGVVK